MTNNHCCSKDEYSWTVIVQAEAHLDYWIKDCFDGLVVRHESGGTTLLTGVLLDLPAVYGVILQLRDTGVEIISLQVERVPER